MERQQTYQSQIRIKCFMLLTIYSVQLLQMTKKFKSHWKTALGPLYKMGVCHNTTIKMSTMSVRNSCRQILIFFFLYYHGWNLSSDNTVYIQPPLKYNFPFQILLKLTCNGDDVIKDHTLDLLYDKGLDQWIINSISSIKRITVQLQELSERRV